MFKISKKDSANKIVYFFTIILLTIFPLYFHRFYFDILQAKYRFYFVTVIAMAVFTIIAWAAYLKKNKVKFAFNIKTLTVPDICFIVLIIIVTISTFQSGFFYESFWGNEGRYNGMFLWLIYGLAYLIITRFLKVKSPLLDFFIIIGIVVCLLSVPDYFKKDILHFKVHIRPSQRDIFTSTFGNINVFTAYVGMLTAVVTVLFTTAKKGWKIIFYYLAMVISFFAIIMGRSDNGYLAIGALFALLPIYLFGKKHGVRRYLISISTLCTCVWVMGIINQLWPDKVLYLDSIFGIMSEDKRFVFVVILLWLLVAAIYIGIKIKPDSGKIKKWPRILWGVFLCLCLAAVIFVLYDANIAGHAARYGKMASYLVFNDSWGTDRGFVWNLSLHHFKEFSIIRKLFGYGPDTFGVLTRLNDFDKMIDYNNTIFDSAHNEYLHYLLTIGLLGTLSYIMLLLTSCIRMIKRAADNPYVMAIMFAVIAYAAQAVVNIAQPVITPVMFTLLMIGLAACREEKNEM